MLEAIFSFRTLWWALFVLYVPACIALIVIVLLQKGKGVGFQGAFGVGGGSEAIFGPRSSRSLPQKLTYAAAALFLFLALVMSMLEGRVTRGAAPGLVEDEATISDTSTGAIEDLLDEDGTEATAAEVLTPAEPGAVGVADEPEAQADLQEDEEGYNPVGGPEESPAILDPAEVDVDELLAPAEETPATDTDAAAAPAEEAPAAEVIETPEAEAPAETEETPAAQ